MTFRCSSKKNLINSSAVLLIKQGSELKVSNRKHIIYSKRFKRKQELRLLKLTIKQVCYSISFSQI